MINDKLKQYQDDGWDISEPWKEYYYPSKFLNYIIPKRYTYQQIRDSS